MLEIKEEKFKSLRKKYMPQYIIQMHTNGEINLSPRQLEEVIKFKNRIENNEGRRERNERNKKS